MSKSLTTIILKTLEDYKALDVVDMDIHELTDVADEMIVCSGTSKRHVQTMANYVVVAAKAAGFPPIGVEGEQFGDWILIDLGSLIVHIMMPKEREFYNLEKLWATTEIFRKSRED